MYVLYSSWTEGGEVPVQYTITVSLHQPIAATHVYRYSLLQVRRYWWIPTHSSDPVISSSPIWQWQLLLHFHLRVLVLLIQHLHHPHHNVPDGGFGPDGGLGMHR